MSRVVTRRAAKAAREAGRLCVLFDDDLCALVFGHLNLRALGRSGAVCTEWHAAAKRVLARWTLLKCTGFFGHRPFADVHDVLPDDQLPVALSRLRRDRLCAPRDAP